MGLVKNYITIHGLFSVSSDEKKRPLYDEYGSFGLYIAEQVGEEFVGSVMFFQSTWFKVSRVPMYTSHLCLKTIPEKYLYFAYSLPYTTTNKSY